jgi:hypothetical protein
MPAAQAQGNKICLLLTHFLALTLYSLLPRQGLPHNPAPGNNFLPSLPPSLGDRPLSLLPQNIDIAAMAFTKLLIAALLAATTSAYKHKPIDDGYGTTLQWRRWFQFMEPWYAQHYQFPDPNLWDEETGFNGCKHSGDIPYHEPHDGLLSNKLLDVHVFPECVNLRDFKVSEGYVVLGHDKYDCKVGILPLSFALCLAFGVLLRMRTLGDGC